MSITIRVSKCLAMAINNTTMVIIIVGVVIVLAVIVWWLGSGCKRDNFSSGGSHPSTTHHVAVATPTPTPTPTAVPQTAPPQVAVGASAGAASPPNNSITTVTSSNPADFTNFKKHEVGDVQAIVMPMETVDTSASDQTLTQGNTHYILRGKKQRIVLPYDATGSAVITEDFVLTQQSGGPSVIVGVNGPPKATPINVNQSYYVQITEQAKKRIYVLQQV